MSIPGLGKLPKIELHCHLDGCLRTRTVAEIADETGLSLPASLEGALIAPDVCANLFHYIGRFDLALEVTQRPRDLARVARELVEDMDADGVVHAEVRFAPQLHTRRGMRLEEVLDAAHGGLESAARDCGVGIGLILCCLRSETDEQSVSIARLAASNTDKVCALDLAGDEGGFPGVGAHRRAFALAAEAGLHRTVHAGEGAGAESVWNAVERLGAERIGHGLRVEDDSELADRVARDGITLEMCPRSNVQTRATHSLATHPIDKFLADGLPVTVSTDARTVSDTTLTGEFERLHEQFGWGLAEFGRCQRNAARAVFAPEEVKADLLARINASLPEPV